MVKPFQFARVPRIYFKNGMIGELPDLAVLYGNKIALVTGKSSFINSENAERLFHDFTQTGIGYHTIVIEGEPSPEQAAPNIETTAIMEKRTRVDLINTSWAREAGNGASWRPPQAKCLF